MCVGVLLVKTPTSEFLISKTPGSLSNLLTPRIISTPTTCLYNPHVLIMLGLLVISLQTDQYKEKLGL